MKIELGSKSLWTHEDAEQGESSEKVGAQYHRWSAAAAQDFIVKTCVPGNTKSCIGRGTMLKTRPAPILLKIREPRGSR